MNATVLINGKQKVTLGQKEYKAQGGQGTVYVSGGLAFKIYHEPSKMIPTGKITELAGIGIANVLAPKDILYDPKSNVPVGFTMPYVSDCEYLTKLFSLQYKLDFSIGNDVVTNLVTEMQKVLLELHKKSILVGDYNEMNFLVDQKFTIPYHIDVDSYQTKNFPCTAIMETVRDRRLPFGKFDEMSDWFSWGIVTFQMFTGVHPYMGRHPDYKPSQLDDRMKNNISVFDPKVKMPKNLQDFSKIPPNLLAWYKSVFVDGNRTIPPFANAVGYVAVAPTVVAGRGMFIVEVVSTYDGETIIDASYINGTQYVITDKAVYKRESLVTSFKTRPTNIRLVNLLGYDPLVSVKVGNELQFFDLSKNKIGSITADAYMVSNKIVYSVFNGNLIENHFDQFNTVVHVPIQVDNIAPVYKMFDGVVVQDVFGKRRLSIPYAHKVCASIDVPELEEYRVIDGKREGQFCILICEKKGKYDRITMYFDPAFTSYEIKIDSDITDRIVNFIVNWKGMVVSVIDGDTLELFMDIKRGSKQLSDSPVDIDMKLLDGVNRNMFINGSSIYTFNTK